MKLNITGEGWAWGMPELRVRTWGIRKNKLGLFMPIYLVGSWFYRKNLISLEEVTLTHGMAFTLSGSEITPSFSILAVWVKPLIRTHRPLVVENSEIKEVTPAHF